MDDNSNTTTTSTTTTTTGPTITHEQLSIALLSQKMDMHNDAQTKLSESIKTLVQVQMANITLTADNDRKNNDEKFENIKTDIGVLTSAVGGVQTEVTKFKDDTGKSLLKLQNNHDLIAKITKWTLGAVAVGMALAGALWSGVFVHH